MDKTTALKTILGISIAGILFSGYLSFSEIIMRTCPIGGCGKLLGIPVCFYGFVMYCGVFAVSIMGLYCRCEKQESRKAKAKKR